MRSIFSIFAGGKRCLPLNVIHGAYAAKYRFFKSLLRHNQAAMSALAEMEQVYYSGRPFSLNSVRIKYEQLFEAVMGVIHNLNAMAKGKYNSLVDICTAIDGEVFERFSPRCEILIKDIVLSFEDITPDMKQAVGAKAANLAVIKNSLGLPVPHGFAVTSFAFEKFMEESGLLKPIEERLSMLSADSAEHIEGASIKIKEMINRAAVPSYIEEEIIKAYEMLESKTHKEVRIAMRSSAVGEDTEATFAGQHSTVLNVTKNNIIAAYKAVIAGKYSARAISYRMHCGLGDRETPMCVAGVVMIDSKASGVVYTVDPTLARSCALQVNSVWGIGEYLVGGGISPDVFLVEREGMGIIEKHISEKDLRLISLRDGGVQLAEVPENEKRLPSIDDDHVVTLCEYGLLIEELYECPQDIEWAMDKDGSLFILQSRPLNLPETDSYKNAVKEEYPDNPILLSGGKTASAGIAAGRVFIIDHGSEPDLIPEGAILVTKTMSPDYAKEFGRIKGLVTDIGSVTSHLASIAREFGIPAIVDTGNATSLLSNGDIITMSADTKTVYRGIVEDLVKGIKPSKKLILGSPVHHKLREILDRISPLNLTDTGHPSFSAEGCKTFHDIIRFTHEYAMREMFEITGDAGKGSVSVKLTSTIPLNLRLIDLGGGLIDGLTICDTITPDHIKSIPMKAIWKGFTHPGVNWKGTMNIDTGGLTSRLAASAVSEMGETPGGDSYAILSKDYLNLSARFAYHFSTIDALCGENSNQNYISINFAGGAGNYYGRSLRAQFMGKVLERLGFKVSIKGDSIEAFIGRYDMKSMEDKIDLVGRLLASSRLLDMTMSHQEEIEIFTEEFFKGNYDFLIEDKKNRLNNFYTHGGSWQYMTESGHIYCVQDGSKWGHGISSGLAGIMGKVIGKTYQEFLDNIEAYYYFPLAVLRDTVISEGVITVKIKPARGNIDRAGGVAFGIKDVDNYFVWRANALEDNVALFEFVNGTRIQRFSARKKVESGEWHLLKVEVKNNIVKGYFNDELLMEYETGESLKGFIGIWTKADSVTYFDELSVEENNHRQIIGF